jgi:curved DNA-binding protein CbpA
MGNIQSVDPTHVRIYNNLLQIKSLAKRQEMIETLLSGNEYIISLKRAGIYGDVLAYIGYLRSGKVPLSPLPGEASATATATATAAQGRATTRPNNELVVGGKHAKDPVKIVGKQKNSQKALSFFTTCLRVLDLAEEVALTEEALKKAYKKKAITSHPDKGGSEEQFESVTRAYAYLSEILKLVKGQRTKDGEQGELPSIDNVKSNRTQASTGFAHAEPVRLDPKNLNMETFNRMFEATRIPDPEDDGYGDWLKNESGGNSSTAPKFGGKFNRNVFNQMFEDDARRTAGNGPSNTLSILGPQQLVMAPSLGLELGREKPQTYTAPANAQINYTDLRQAYTTGSTFSGEVAGVSVAPRSLESYKANRESAPILSDAERQGLEEYERSQQEAEKRRQFRAAQEHVVADEYFERMKRLVIRNN